MEEIGAQVAPPVAIHQRFCNMNPIAKKRGLPFHSSSIGHQNPSDNWNPKSWDWDSSRFVATPAQQSDGVRAGNPSGTDQSGKGDKNVQLNVGGGAGNNGGPNLVEETQSVPRPNKRVRSGSPGGASHHPMCQVDDCEEDLSRAKDYHRRHKVCEVHSKASKASVGKQLQRFCQQCSRFHPLPEFDEGKRSCRRRLAGHNRRRRKTQTEETTTPRVLLPDNPQKNFNCDVDVINLLTVLAHAQGSTVDKSGRLSTITPDKDKDNLMQQLLSKINLLPLPGHLESTPPFPETMSPIISNQAQSEKSQNQMSEKASAPSTMDLLAVLSATPSDAETQSQPSNEPSDSEKSKSTAHIDQTSSYHSPMEETDMSPSLQLQLFSSSPEDSSVRRFPLGGNYVSSNSSNPSEERSSPVSSPLVHNLFPMQTSRETTKDARLSNSEDEIAYMKPVVSNGCSTSLQLFGRSIGVNENGSIQSSPHRAGYTSSSGSDHSPFSLNSDAQERTDRIIFKLFDKDPSHLPESLRKQIYNWLSNSPSEMESYIRPGCIVLSLYLSMSSFAWNKLEENFLSHVKSLVNTDDFWGNGRFLVYTDRKMVSHKDGAIRLSKSRRDWITPELISVSPVAIVAGQETSLLLRGRNLTAPSTTIHCTHAYGYSIEKVASSCQSPGQDEISLSSFKIREAAASHMFGRCFIEVENRFKGTVFPVIIADNTICQELRLLEGATNQETLHFLNELGWLFQRKSNSSLFRIPNYKLYRFSFLLTFSIERDFCSLVKTLLDILLELNLGREGLANESLEMLSEIHLLNRAVRRRCRAMVDLLVNYSVLDSDSSSRRFIFSPDLAGPGGLTPLHLAACTSSSDDIVDSLTNDPQATGMKNWNSVLDVNGLSPFAYASMRNNHSYNVLVARKISDRRKGQISVLIEENEMKPFEVEINDKQGQKSSSCSRCAVAAARAYSRRFPPGLLQRPYIHSMLVVAAVCVCVCLLLRGRPNTSLKTPLVWENMRFGVE